MLIFLSQEWLSVTVDNRVTGGQGPAYERALSVLPPLPNSSSSMFAGQTGLFFGVDPAAFGYVKPLKSKSLDFCVVKDPLSLKDVPVVRCYYFPLSVYVEGFSMLDVMAPLGWKAWSRLNAPLASIDVDFTREFTVVAGILTNTDLSSSEYQRNIGLSSVDVPPVNYCPRLRKVIDAEKHVCIPFDVWCVTCNDLVHWCPHIAQHIMCLDCRVLTAYGCGKHRVAKSLPALVESKKSLVFSLRSGIINVPKTISPSIVRKKGPSFSSKKLKKKKVLW